MQKEKREPLITRNQVLRMYQQFPGALARELLSVFEMLEEPRDMANHNYILEKVMLLCPDRDRLVKAVAKAIIATAKEGVTDGP